MYTKINSQNVQMNLPCTNWNLPLPRYLAVYFYFLKCDQWAAIIISGSSTDNLFLLFINTTRNFGGCFVPTKLGIFNLYYFFSSESVLTYFGLFISDNNNRLHVYTVCVSTFCKLNGKIPRLIRMYEDYISWWNQPLTTIDHFIPDFFF